jgi:exodeoxyribonuclease VII large subunit
MNNNHIQLSELLFEVKQALKVSLSSNYWIVAEISEISTNYSGHCYLELIEKDNNSNGYIAKCKATIWSYKYRMIKPFFETSTGISLQQGIKVLIQVSVEFHELYGISLNITDIDPIYTIGEQERKRREIIVQLTNDGIINLNKQHELPEIPKNIAVISSKTAAGYGDFFNQLQNNKAGYCFHIQLFPAIMQGDKAEESIIAALDAIYSYESIFDIVVIIRGGGSQSDLSCFDNYSLASNIAQFPLPILTGIGHDKDSTIADIVAHTQLKTPTAVAEYLISLFDEVSEYIETLQIDFENEVRQILQKNNEVINTHLQSIQYITKNILSHNKHKLNYKTTEVEKIVSHFTKNKKNSLSNFSILLKHKLDFVFKQAKMQHVEYRNKLSYVSEKQIVNQKNKLSILNEKIKQFDPSQILEKGFSITVDSKGRIIKNSNNVNQGDTIKTIVAKGEIISIVKV